MFPTVEYLVMLIQVLNPSVIRGKMQPSDDFYPSFHNNPSFFIIFLNNGILR